MIIAFDVSTGSFKHKRGAFKVLLKSDLQTFNVSSMSGTSSKFIDIIWIQNPLNVEYKAIMLKKKMFLKKLGRSKL